MAFTLDRSIDVLQRTPEVLRAMLGGLGDFWSLSNYGENTFSPFDVVGHLIHAEKTDWMVRIRVILEHGDAQPFPPFDRYAMYEASRDKPMAQLLDEFARLRRRSLDDVRAMNLSPADFDRKGKHPALGGVTLKELIATWVVHDLGHTHQVAKAMAYQYRDDVGPWREYLTILPSD